MRKERATSDRRSGDVCVIRWLRASSPFCALSPYYFRNWENYHLSLFTATAPFLYFFASS